MGGCPDAAARQQAAPQRHGRARAAARRVALLLALLLLTAMAHAEGPWDGIWESHTSDGTARLLIRQDGNRVVGSWPLHGGGLDATAEGRRAVGRWFEDGDEGRVEMMLARDGRSFLGRRDDGDWQTGRRIAAEEPTLPISLRSPRDTMRSFVMAGALARDHQPDAWSIATSTIDFGPPTPGRTRADDWRFARQLFDLLDLTTFDVEDLPDGAGLESITLRFEQSRSLAAMPLTLARDAAGAWRIRPPSAEEMAAIRRTLVALRGDRMPARDEFRRLGSPRDTMRAFLEGMSRWTIDGPEQALGTIDLSIFPEVIRIGEGRMAAHHLRRAIDRIGMAGLQSIPNDGSDRSPYLHFVHPLGRIVIAPAGPEPDAPWRFTAETAETVAELDRVLEDLPPPAYLPPGAVPEATFFRLRDAVVEHAPVLLRRVGRAELWQVIGGLGAVAAGVAAGLLAAGLLARLLRWIFHGPVELPDWFRWAFALPVALALVSPVPTILGIPFQMRHYTVPLFGILGILLGTAALWHLLRVVADNLSTVVARTWGAADDILLSLAIAAARTGLVIAAALGIAQFLSISPTGILAGLGIGGLAVAFASRETLSNVFGAGILVTDRPFKRGDWITSGDISGAVEHVGIRSTRLRTAQGSMVVVPNGKLADSGITNQGEGPARTVKAQLLVTAGGSAERIGRFAQALRRRIQDDAAFLAAKTLVQVDGLTAAGVELSLVTQLALDAPPGAREALLLDAIRLAEAEGMTLGAGLAPATAAAA